MKLLKSLNTHNELLQLTCSAPEIPNRKRLFAHSILALVSGFTFSNITQAVTIAKLADSSQFPSSLSSEVSLNGDTAVFQTPAVTSFYSALYSMNINTGVSSIVKLLDSTTPIPQGIGNFDATYLTVASHFTVSNDKVFLHYNGGNQSGVYSIPVSGGAVTMLFNQSSQKPDTASGTFLGTSFLPHSIKVDGNYVLAQQPGYKFDTSTGILTRIFKNEGPAIYDPIVDANGNVATFVVESFGDSNNPNHQFAIVATPYSNTIDINYGTYSKNYDLSNPNVIVSGNTIVPGTASNPRTFEPTRTNILGMSSPFGNPKIDAGTVIFSGAAKPISVPGIDNKDLDLWGLYSTTSNPGGEVKKLADTQTAIPEGTGNFDASTFQLSSSYQISDGNVVFWGYGKANNVNQRTRGLYLSSLSGDKLTKIVADGDTLVDGTIANFEYTYDFSLSGNHVLFYNAGSFYLATLNDNGGSGGNTGGNGGGNGGNTGGNGGNGGGTSSGTTPIIGQTESADQVQVNQPFSYTVSFANYAPSVATSVKLTDTLPKKTKLVSAVTSLGKKCKGKAPVVCSFGTVASGANVSATITVTRKKPGQIKNSAFITYKILKTGSKKKKSYKLVAPSESTTVN